MTRPRAGLPHARGSPSPTRLRRPGTLPRWTKAAKDGVGTAYSASSRLWFTASAGVVTEIYYPSTDEPQVRDLQYLVTDGGTFFHDERRNTESTVEYLDSHSLGLRITNRRRGGVELTFYGMESNRWDGKNYRVKIAEATTT